MKDPRREERAERIVPAIQRSAIRDGDERVIRAALVERCLIDDPADTNDRSKSPRQVSTYRRVDPLLTLHRSGDFVTKQHLQAAEQYRDDWELADGAMPGYQRPEVRGGGGTEPSATQLDALSRWRMATQAVGIRQSVILVSVALGGQSVTSYAKEHAISRHIAMGFLIAALDRLEEHYQMVALPKKMA